MDPRKVCQICGEHAKANKSFFAHYGVICCLSCKAFFRRIHQEQKDINRLVCKGSGTSQCDISSMKRGKCKRCRYFKCLDSGLRPDQVLDEEERKKFTFPHKQKPKRSQKAHDSNDKSPAQSSEEEGSPPNEPQFAIKDIMEHLLANKMELSLDEVEAQAVIGAHLQTQWSMEQSTFFIGILRKTTAVMADFAIGNQYLNSLCSEDQELLLWNNSELYTQYIMARYFGSDCGLDQLTWLIPPQKLTLWQIQQLVKVPFDQVNCNGAIIPLDQPNMIQGYSQLFSLIHKYFKYPQLYNGVIAFYLLFATNHWPSHERERLVELRRVQWINDLGKDLINLGCQGLSIGSNQLDQLVSSLKTMATISCHKRLSTLAENLELQTMLEHQGEKEWLATKLDIFHEAVVTVQVDGNYIQMIMDFNFGDYDLRPQVCFYTANVVTKRFQLVIDKLLPSLGYGERVLLSKFNFQRGAFVGFVRMLDAKTFQEQIDFLTGSCCVIPGGEHMELLTMDKYNGKTPLCKKHQKFHLSSLRRSIGMFIAQKDFWLLSTYIVLLDHPDNPKVISLKNLFLRILCKMVRERKEYKNQNPEMVVHEFFKNLHDYALLLASIAQEFEGE